MHWMPEILYRFRRVCPDIDVDLRMVDHELEPFELLEKWETDVIFAARQPGFACDWTPLWNDPMCAILPQDYPLTGDEFPIEEFTDKEFLMPYGGSTSMRGPSLSRMASSRASARVMSTTRRSSAWWARGWAFR